MHMVVARFSAVAYFNVNAVVVQIAAVTDLTTRLGVKRSAVQNHDDFDIGTDAFN